MTKTRKLTKDNQVDPSILLMTNMVNSFALINCLSGIPTFNKIKNSREYIQDLRNAYRLVRAEIHPQFLQNAL